MGGLGIGAAGAAAAAAVAVDPVAARAEPVAASEAASAAGSEAGGGRGGGKVGGPVPAEKMRGKHGKDKKKKKYADQDEEDRELFLNLMGSAGASKADLKRDAQQRESEAKAAIKAEKDARVLRNAQTAQRKREDEAQRWQEKREAQEETRREREAAAAAAAGGGAGGGAGVGAAEEDAEEEEGESGALDGELAALLEQPSAIALGEGLTSQLGLQVGVRARARARDGDRDRDRVTSTLKAAPPTVKRLVPGFVRSISGSSHVRYAAIWPVRSYTASVNSSSAGPPFCALYLMPKSFSGPPGLCEAVSRMPPYATPPSRSRMTAEAAGVESRPSRPTHTRETPLAAAMRQIVWMACWL